MIRSATRGSAFSTGAEVGGVAVDGRGSGTSAAATEGVGFEREHPTLAQSIGSQSMSATARRKAGVRSGMIHLGVETVSGAGVDFD